MKSARQLQFEQPSAAALDAQRARSAVAAHEALAVSEQIGGMTVAWIHSVADVARRDGNALRPGVGPWIEAQSINNSLWYPLTLEGRKEGDVLFGTIADRDLVLAEIQRLAGRLEPVCPECQGQGYTSSLGGVTRDCDCVRRAARG